MSTTISSKFTHQDHPQGAVAARRSLPLRVRVAIRRDALTRALAEGAPAAASAELTLRASQLSNLRRRHQLAGSWRKAVKEARQPASNFAYAPLVRRRAVIDADDAIKALIVRLSNNEPVAVQGMAMLDRLTTDGASSPLFAPAEPGALTRELIVATKAMDEEPVALPLAA
jgi:hypothetical protein